MSSYTELLSYDIFEARADQLEFSTLDQIRLPYERARLVCQQIGMTVEDVVKLKPKFWEFFRHPIFARDSAMGTTLAIHWNLCIGTIGTYASRRPDLIPWLEKLINFDLCGEFLLTEIGRGLDARNLETTATLQSDGSFDLHTPSVAAAKAMPPTSPWAGVGRVGVVFARLMVNGADHGVKTFIVHLSNEKELSPGVTSQLLPKRCGSKALDHALTSFTHVRLGPESLLGSLSRAEDQRTDFFRQIHRVPTGTLSLSMANIPALKFPTQYRPILDAVVQSQAYGVFADEAIAVFLDTKLPMEVRHGVAVCFKTAVGTDTQTSINELAERCGWQGLFGYNGIIEMALALRGNAVAEGDYTVLCIRLVSEILLERYQLPEPRMKACPLARHEAGIWQEARDMMASLGNRNHRSEEFNAHLLPRCRDLVKATGHRMAYEAAASSGKLTAEALDLFKSTCMKADLSWYCQFEGLNRNEFHAKDTMAAKAALPLLREFLNPNGASSQDGTIGAAVAPIMDEKLWGEFVHNLPTFTPTTTIDIDPPAYWP
ncbi:hypothetical protein NUW58_g2454 [Xylaria curta]|uniref:Uncharacterized protein n=1 Tax=Xylaria curta TaxID=42375 RepID=A0ACC1PH79_9PEZI|nr:hypothetical protein NUW58_g2454 [Xylaria curta]